MSRKGFISRLFMVICFCMMLSLSCTKNVSASYKRYITAYSLNIRAKASKSSKVVGSYKRGTKVTCYGTKKEFTKVKYGGRYRYISSSYLSSKKPVVTYKRYVTAGSLNIRKKASSKAAVVGTYKKGTKITCYGTSKGFTKVKYSGAYRYVSTSYLSTKKPETTTTTSSTTSTYIRYITADSLNIRATASTSGKIVGTYSKGTKITCYGTSGSFTKVKYNGVYCYVSTNYLSSSPVSTSNTEVNGATGSQVADYALQFVGNPYVWGGSSLTNGADCSGFTMSVFAHFGYSLPHSSVSQRSCGTAVSSSSRKAGDLICYNNIDGVGHVGIYIGNDQVVHAGNEATGIHISTWNYRSVNCVRRIF